MEKIFNVNGSPPKIRVRVAVFVSDNIEFNSKPAKRHKEGLYIMIKGSGL
jgi:hypothetical protein